MRKIQLLLVALFAAVGSAFAAVPAANDVGYLYNPATKTFLNASATLSPLGVAYTTIENKAAGDSFGSDDASIPESGYTYMRFTLDGTKNNCLRVYNDRIGIGSGYSKWAVMDTDNGLVIRCIYTSTQSNNALSPFAKQGYYVTPAEDGTLAIVEEPTEASYWQYMAVEDYVALPSVKDALLASVPTGEMAPDVKENLDKAVADYEAEQTVETFNALTEAIAAAEASIKEIAVIKAKQGVYAGDDVTFIIANPGFDNKTTDGWTSVGGAIKGESINPMVRRVDGTFEVSQTLTDLRPGKYLLKVQAFGREEANAAVWEKYLAGEAIPSGVYMFAGETKKDVKAITDDLSYESLESDQSTLETAEGLTVYIPNGSNSIARAFTNGLYENELEFVVGEEGTVTIGVKKENEYSGSYAGVDNFRLYYVCPPEPVKPGDAPIKPELIVDIAQADLDVTGATPQYFFNVEARAFIIGANDWGTRVSFSKTEGYQMSFEANGDTYNLNAIGGKANSLDCQGPDNLWVDGAGRGGSGKWTFKVNEEDGTFTISNTNVSGLLSVLPSKNDTKLYMSDAAEAQSKWIAVNVEDLAAYVEKYNEALPAYTENVLKPYEAELAEYNKAVAEYEALAKEYFIGNYKVGDEITSIAPATWTGQTGNFQERFERYQGGSIGEGDVMTQTLTNLKNGTYVVTLNAAASFTSGRGFECPVGEGLAVAFANDMEQGLEVIDRGWVSEFDDIVIKTVVTDGTLKYGIKNLVAAGNWYVAGLVSIVYESTNTVLDPTAEEIAELIASMPDVEAPMNITVKEAMLSAKDALDAEPTFANFVALRNAINSAKASVSAYESAAEALDAMAALIEKTNVYTEDALDTYFTQYYEKYVASTLTTSEAQGLQNPDVVTGWHASITVDNFLLSAWDTNPDFNNAPYYINTWSVEGDNDGTNFRVPFFEYWTGDDNSLGEKTLTATMTDLETGQYEVSAWVRVRAKNGTAAADATGITLQVNDAEEVVDVTEGEPVGDSQFNIAEYIAKGDVVDGTLKIKFIVAADNNISWLSFKNVKFEKVSDATKIAGVTEKAAQKAIFNAAGQQMKSLQKGINIVDGAKIYVK